MADFPTVGMPIPNEITAKYRHYNVTSESLNGRIQVRSLGVTRRSYNVKFPPMKRSAFATLWAFVASLEGSYNSFIMWVPDPSSSDPFDFVTGTGCQEVTVRLDGDLQEFSYGLGDIVSYEFDVVEVLTDATV